MITDDAVLLCTRLPIQSGSDMAIDPKNEKPLAASEPRSLSMRENRLDSREIFVGTREITIAHGEELYRLRLTAQNKLILTK